LKSFFITACIFKLTPERPESAAAEKRGDFSAAAEVLRLEYHFELAS
jgi:hypothetical protein